MQLIEYFKKIRSFNQPILLPLDLKKRKQRIKMTLNKDAVKGFLDYLNSENEKSKSKNELFDNESKKVSMQVCFHKIPNLLSEKRINW